MKYRLMALFMTVALLLTGCAPEISLTENVQQIYASFYPIYALSSLVLDEIPGIRLKCLVQPQDDCLRLYELSDWDASVISYDTDCIIIGGNGLESFESALYSLEESGAAVITSTYSVELIEHAANSDMSTTGHLAGENPHAYMSAARAEKMVHVIANAMSELYPEYREQISENISEASSQFDALNERIDEVRSRIGGKSVIAMNEALVYVAEDYGLEIAYQYDRESATTLYGSGLSEAIAAFEQTGAEVILIEEQAPAELVKALEEAGFRVAALDIMSGGRSDETGGYMLTQLKNASVLDAAFNK